MAKIDKNAAAGFRIKNIFVTLIVSALGFLVALQWRDTIRQTIDVVIPEGQGLFYSYAVTTAITTGAVVVIYILTRIEKTDIVPDTMETQIKDGVKNIRRKAAKKVI